MNLLGISAFYPSNFEEVAILTIDGVGEWVLNPYAKAKEKTLRYNVLLTPDNRIKDDEHPDESVDDVWAERIAECITQYGIIKKPTLA